VEESYDSHNTSYYYFLFTYHDYFIYQACIFTTHIKYILEYCEFYLVKINDK
jgi:hypothetical protein